ncbi:IS982 family transposase [Cardinium endosymbiont of Oedothorax gibbosus]|uniref:IS982 family transposase n=1 Tax=Cardinium endosymbiont of Oedothorax gibbosus TaxID=931101 RepID=UPI0020241B3A|nr:IS982 family transposase [Cardinium endosymbiont of Oedothorax gibbosus]CAH2560039.1 Transposase ISCca4, IS982 family [Cardinium endosymbiont of Oedothorax gibbosus]
MNVEKLVEIYYAVNEFLIKFMPYMEKQLLTNSKRKPTRTCSLTLSEIMTIIIAFHVIGFRNFKAYYLHLQQFHSNEFKTLVSYNRFIELVQRTLILFYFFTKSLSKTQTGCYFMDAAAVKVCNIKRAHSNRVFKSIATKGKTSTGWFFGLKLHLIVNDLGEIMNFQLTTGKTNDRLPVEDLCKHFMGKMFADKGYISKDLFEKLMGKGVELITQIRKNMKNAFMPLWDKLMLRKRSIIETIIDQLKNISQIEHSRHRSIPNFPVNLIAGITAYALKDKKPSITNIYMTGSQYV